MEETSSLAYSEVYAILNLIEDKYVNKIPQKIIDFFDNARDKNYNPTIDVNIPLDEQNLKRETIILLAILNYNYWCDSNEEKKEIEVDLITNNETKELELKEKYSPFKYKNEIKEIEPIKNQDVQLVEYKEENFIKRLLQKIMSSFKR